MRSLTSGDADFQVYPVAPKLRLYGINVRNLSNTPVTVTVHHGTSSIGPTLVTITLQPKQSGFEWPEPGGLPAENGLYVDRIGLSELAVYFRA